MKKKTGILSVVGFLLFIYFFPLTSFGQEGKILPGFDKAEFLELLKISSYQGDTLYNPDLPPPLKFKKIYRSKTMGLDNRWDLWVSDQLVAVISIRGTTPEKTSWLENFYAAMVPA